MATVLISIVWFGHTIGATQWAFVGVAGVPGVAADWEIRASRCRMLSIG